MIWCPQCRKLVEPTLKRKRRITLTVCPHCNYTFATCKAFLNVDEEERRFKLWLQGFSDVEIARKLGLSNEAVRGWRNRRGLPANRPNRKMRVYKPFLDAVPGRWVPASEVAKQLNCSSKRVAKILKQLAELGFLERVKKGQIFLYRRVK